MSTQATWGSNSSQREKSKSKLKQSSSNATARSSNPAQSTSQACAEQKPPFNAVANYLDDTTHTTPGYRSAAGREYEVVMEAQLRAQQVIDGFDKCAGK